MTGVKDTVVYRGPEGVVTRQEGLAFVQYHAVRQTARGPKGRYYNSERGAIAWLRRQAESPTCAEVKAAYFADLAREEED